MTKKECFPCSEVSVGWSAKKQDYARQPYQLVVITGGY